MRLRTLGLTFTALTMLSASAHAAVIITISDLSDGNPVVTTGNLTAASITNTPEGVLIQGRLDPGNVTQGVVAGRRSVILVEPNSDVFGPRFSDFVTLLAGDIQQDANGIFQPIAILFESDSFDGFLRDLAALPVGTPSILEDGTMQDVSALLNAGGLATDSLQILVQSELTSGDENTPEPSSLLLMGTGLLGCAAYIRRRKTSQAS